MVMTLFRVEVAAPAGLENEPTEPVFVDSIRPGPAIRMPFEGDRFSVTDEWGRDHHGVITSVEHVGVARAEDVIGADRALDLNIAELRVLHLRMVPHRLNLTVVRDL